MQTADVNVLLAAFRGDHPHHAVARAWLDDTLADDQPLLLMPFVVASFLRLMTSSKVFAQPSTAQQAVACVDALLARPAVRLAELGPEWPELRRLCVDKRLSGNAIPDAWLAAATLHLAAHLVTFDKDFRRLLPRNRLSVLAPAA